jgi:hypothetical protein
MDSALAAVVCEAVALVRPRREPAALPADDQFDNSKEAVMAETWSGEFYCVKCKEKREAEGRVVETNGRRMAKGSCPVCGTNLNRILGKA